MVGGTTRVRTGADTSTRVQEVNYTYFTSGTHSADVGTAGHLVQVKRMSLRSSGSPGTSADWIVRYTQYRYGSNGLVKAVYEADAIQRILDNTSLNVASADAILTKGDLVQRMFTTDMMGCRTPRNNWKNSVHATERRAIR